MRGYEPSRLDVVFLIQFEQPVNANCSPEDPPRNICFVWSRTILSIEPGAASELLFNKRESHVPSTHSVDIDAVTDKNSLPHLNGGFFSHGVCCRRRIPMPTMIV